MIRPQPSHHPSHHHPYQHQLHNPPRELFYTQPGPTNRMILSLLSPDLESVDWALSQLSRLSGLDRFDLSAWPQSLPALLRYPTKLIEFSSSLRAGLSDHSFWEAGLGATVATGGDNDLSETRRRATESLLVLRNAGVVNDGANGRLLGEGTRLMVFLEGLLSLRTEVLLDHLVEPLLLGLDILYNIATSPSHRSSLLRNTISNSSSAFPAVLVPLLEHAKDTAVLLALFRLVNALTTPIDPESSLTPAPAPIAQPIGSDDDEGDEPVATVAVQTSIPPVLPLTFPLVPAGFLAKSLVLLALPPVPINQALRTAALDYLYTYTTYSHQAVTILKRPDVGPIFRLLARGLYEGSTEQRIYPPMSESYPIEWDEPPTDEELQELLTVSEPTRSRRWIERTFAPASQSQHVSQVAFFTEYRHAFTATGFDVAVPPTVPAQDLIRQISDVIRGATAQTIPNLNGPGKAGYVIQGVTRKTSRGGKDGVAYLYRERPTERPIPTDSYNLAYQGLHSTTTPYVPRTNLHDERLPTPTGNAFGAALVLRNLSRAIVELLHKPEDNPQDNAADTEAGLDGAGLRGRGMGKAGKEKKLRDGDMFGLPIPEGLMILGQGQGISRGGQSRRPTPSDGGMDVDEQPEELEEIHLPPEVLTQHEAERAKGALKGVEDLALDWAVRGDGLGEWMGEVLESIALMERS